MFGRKMCECLDEFLEQRGEGWRITEKEEGNLKFSGNPKGRLEKQCIS